MVVVADERIVAQHQRQPGKGKTAYDWQHYGCWCNASREHCATARPYWTCPSLWPSCAMAQVLSMVGVAGPDAVLVAAELALEHAGPGGRVSPEHVGNLLARLTAPPRPDNVATALSTLTRLAGRHHALRPADHIQAASTAPGCFINPAQ